MQELQRRVDEAKQRVQIPEKELRETTLTEYLSFCHGYLSKSISVETNMSLCIKRSSEQCRWQIPSGLSSVDIQKGNYNHFILINPSNDFPRTFDNRNATKIQSFKENIKEVGK